MLVLKRLFAVLLSVGIDLFHTAPVVRLIFSLCAEGKGPKVIANMLREKQILKPTAYRYKTSGKYGATTDTDDIYGWNDRTVAGILDNEIYLGHTINCRTTVASYKDKRKKDVPESEWYRFENTHEAIIDKVTWDIVRKVRESKRRRTNMLNRTSTSTSPTSGTLTASALTEKPSQLK